MRSKAIFLALLALSFMTQAEPVSLFQARTAASSWARERRTLGVRLGTAAKSVTEHRKANGEYFYAVQMKDGGTVFLSGDTTLEPVLAFTSSADSLPLQLRGTGDKTVSPLEAMLSARRVSRETTSPNTNNVNRVQLKRLTVASSTSSTSAQPQTAAERKWAKLLNSAVAPRRLMASVSKVPEVDDLRVAPLLRTKWSQSESYTAKDKNAAINCFNYYTPTVAVTYYEADNSETKTNETCVCGCVATAMAQLIRHWEVPGNIVSFDNFNDGEFAECKWLKSVTFTRDADGTIALYRDEYSYGEAKYGPLKTWTSPYDWANMTDFPLAANGTNELGETEWVGTPVTEANCQAIGKLTYDCGISVGMSYDLAYFGGSSISTANADRIPKALESKFGYAQALLCADADGLSSSENGEMRAKAICSNLDAGCPVILLITGNGGHAVVGDGYGFSGEEETPYVHLNMGWSGQCDVWYNLPLVETGDNPEAFSGFWAIPGVVYNVYPDRARGEIVSGYVFDDVGAVTNLPVRLYADGRLVQTTTTSTNGVYSFFVEPGRSYVVKATNDMAVAEAVTPVIVKSTGTVVGNSWGNDLSLQTPAVTIGTDAYSSVDTALEALQTGDMAVVRTDAALDGVHEIAVAGALVGASDDPLDNPVVMGDASGLTVVAGGVFSLSNVVFVTASGEMRQSSVVSVSSGGSVRIDGPVGFDVTNEVAAIRTADARGLILGTVLTTQLVVSCEAAAGLGAVFGRVAKNVSKADAEACAALLRNAQDDKLYGRAFWTQSDGIVLKWTRDQLPLEDAACYLVDGDGRTNTASSVEEMLKVREIGRAEGRLTGAEEIVVRQSLTLSSRIVVEEDLTLRGEGDVVLSVGADEAGFTVTSGTLTLTGLSFAAGTSVGLLVVDGEAAVLTLRDCAFADLVSSSPDGLPAAVQVLRGRLLAERVVFERCINTPVNACGRGGAIYVAGDGRTNELSDVTITGCRASECGGGVCVDSGAVLRIRGSVQISGNQAGDGIHLAADDICLGVSEAELQVGSLDQVRSVVGVRALERLDAGDEFATYVGTEADVTNTVSCLFNDAQPELDAAFGPSAGAASPLFWAVHADDRTVPFADAVVMVGEDPELGPWKYYASLADAFEAIGLRTATVKLLKDVTFAEDLLVKGFVTLCSSGDVARAAVRLGNVSLRIGSGGSLAVTNMTVRGGTGEIGLFKVVGGGLDLLPGATVTDFNGTGARDACAIVVSGGGSFAMESGSCISDCVNSYDDDADGTGRGAALLVDDGRADLRGGTVRGCRAAKGAVFVGNLGTVNVSGDLVITDNVRLDGTTPCNLSVHESDCLVLVGELTGAVGYTAGEAADERIFGRVSPDYTDAVGMVASAHHFRNDQTGDIGMVVSGVGTNLLVWSSALAADGSFADAAGRMYRIVPGGEIALVVPQAHQGLVYSGQAQVGVESGFGYVLTGVFVATNAGPYEATATLRPGFVWEGSGEFSPTNVAWTIAKAKCSLVDVGFTDTTLPYTGKEQALLITGIRPECVEVTYENNVGTDPAAYENATATFRISADQVGNYQLVNEAGQDVDEIVMTATLTIAFGGEVDPTPIAFKSIARVSEAEWALVVTDRVQWAEYRLLWTEDLTKGFTSTGGWEQATLGGAWTTNVIFTAPAPAAVFWKAEAQRGQVPANE